MPSIVPIVDLVPVSLLTEGADIKQIKTYNYNYSCWGGEGGGTEGSGTFWTIVDLGSHPGLGKCNYPCSETLCSPRSWWEAGRVRHHFQDWWRGQSNRMRIHV